MPDVLLPFQDFIKSLRKRIVARSIPTIKNKNARDESLEVMRNYLLKLYKGIKNVHSYIDDDGQVWDCIPLQHQPSLKGTRDRIFENTPPFPNDASENTNNVGGSINSANSKIKDAFGNNATCPEGYIPLRRLTLQEMVRFSSLEESLQKEVGLVNLDLLNEVTKVLTPDNVPRKYVFASDVVLNRGAGANINLWQPPLLNNLQMMSLSQIWVLGGSGNQRQTIEVGWQVYPRKYGTNSPVLFIYWTGDNYNTTGSYNLEMQNTFVQTNGTWRLGGALSPVSIPAKAQIDIRFDWVLINNAWWLYINKTAVGYYPKQIFGAGSLSRAADTIIVGGEVAGQGSFPPMGSGMFAQFGFGNSAYIRNNSFVDQNGVIRPLNLVPQETARNCYNYSPGTDPTWGASFFYGGPGGNQC